MQKVFWLIVFVAIHILPADTANPTYGIFDLPTEVLDRIVQNLIFKDREFDDEFYARTQAYAPKREWINEVKDREEIQKDVVQKAISRDGIMRILTKECLGVYTINVLLCVELCATKKIIKKYRINRCNNDLVRAYFNKQGTKAIAYRDTTSSSTINISLATDQDHEHRSKKTFHEYCKQYYICKGVPVLIAADESKKL